MSPFFAQGQLACPGEEHETTDVLRALLRLPANIGALIIRIIRIRYWDILYYIYNKEPPK